jgi:hypothetical protein
MLELRRTTREVEQMSLDEPETDAQTQAAIERAQWGITTEDGRHFL